MAVPTSYTEEAFSQYLEARLSHVATALGWVTGANGGDYEEIINDVLLAMGFSDIADVPAGNIQELRILAELYLWRSVAMAFSADYDFSADGGSYSRSQLQEHASRRLEEAERRAMPYDPAYQVTAHKASYHRDPYADHDDALTDDIDEYQEDLKSS